MSCSEGFRTLSIIYDEAFVHIMSRFAGAPQRFRLRYVESIVNSYTEFKELIYIEAIYSFNLNLLIDKP